MIAIHSDDFGYNRHTDKKILRLLRRGKIKSLSVLSNMVDKKGLRNLKRALEKNPDCKIGLHLNLVEDKSIYGKEYISTLVNNKGQFFSLSRFVLLLELGKIEKEHIEKEITSQIKKLRAEGIKLKFIDSHRHIHALSPMAEIVEKIAQSTNIKHIRSYNRVKTYTIQAKIKYLFVKLMAFVSYIISYGKPGLPASWRQNGTKAYSFSSWEGRNVYFSKIKDKNLVLVIHPYLPFDRNLSYMTFFSD